MSDRGFEDDLRRRFLEPPPGVLAERDCPPPERVLDAVLGKLSAASNREIADHSAVCPSCTVAWKLARDYVSEAGPEAFSANRAVGAGRTARMRSRYWIPAAAALAAAFAALVIWLPVPPTDVTPPVLRAPVQDPIRSLVAEDLPLAADSFTLRWSPGPDGTRYDLRVTDRRLEHLAGARSLEQAEFTIPAAALERLEAGALVLWQVEATLPDGRRQVSPTFAARLE